MCQPSRANDVSELAVGEKSWQGNELLAGKAQGKIGHKGIGRLAEQQADPRGKSACPPCAVSDAIEQVSVGIPASRRDDCGFVAQGRATIRKLTEKLTH